MCGRLDEQQAGLVARTAALSDCFQLLVDLNYKLDIKAQVVLETAKDDVTAYVCSRACCARCPS